MIFISGFINKPKCQRHSSPHKQGAWTRELWTKVWQHICILLESSFCSNVKRNQQQVCAETANLPETSGKTVHLSRAVSPVSNKMLDRGKIARMKERRACIILGKLIFNMCM